MKKLLFTIALLFICGNSFSQEVLPEFSDQTLPTLNDELRKINRKFNTVIPKGLIAIWSGAITAIPTTWALCDGTNGTPDLTDRFVIHADADSGGTNDVGDTGGASTHTLTSEQSGIVAHSHEVLTRGAATNGTVIANTATSPGSNISDTEAVASADAAEAHSNRDKYYALAYIQKL